MPPPRFFPQPLRCTSPTSRHLGAELEIDPPVWQADTFDHILRSADSYTAKWEYVHANPVRAGFVARSEDWPSQGELFSLKF